MNDHVRFAIDLVRQDTEMSGVPSPPYIDEDWTFYDNRTTGGPELVATVADQLQVGIIEELWPEHGSNWPVCPEHPRSHPMKAIVVDGEAVWACVDGTPQARIGALFSSHHQARRARKKAK